MTNKAFFLLVIAALLLGGGLGGILIVVLPPGDDDNNNLTMSPAALPPPGASLGGGAPDLARLQLLGQGTQIGDMDPQELEAELGRLRQQFALQGQPITGAAGPAGGAGLLGGAGLDGPLPGVVESVEEGVLTLDTPIGPLQAAVGDDTAVTVISEEEGTLNDLTAGLHVTLAVEPNEDGSMKASSVTVLPEGATFPIGGRFAGGANPQQQAELRQRFAERGQSTGAAARPATGGGLFRGAATGGGLTGVIESLEGGVLVVNTSVGPLQASVGDDTAVTVFAETQGTLDDLTSGLQVMVSVEPSDDGSMQASSVIVLPEGIGLPTGGGFGRQGGLGGAQGGLGGP